MPTTITGTANDDFIYSGTANHIVYGLGGNDTIGDQFFADWTPVSNDIFYGGDGNDTLIYRNGNDTLYGDAGNDVIKVYKAFDDHDEGLTIHIWGGEGTDNVEFRLGDNAGENDVTHQANGNTRVDFGDMKIILHTDVEGYDFI